MRLTRLRLVDWRSYRQADVPFKPGLQAIVGPNGSGKTNLLEAVAALAGLRMSRARVEADQIRWQADTASVWAHLVEAAGPLEVLVTVSRTGRRRSRWNGVEPSRSLRTGPSAVLFTPDDLSLVKGAAEDRRALLDRDLGHADRRYRALLSRYLRALQHRNAVLKGLRERPPSGWEEPLRPWDEVMAPLAVALTAWRRDAVAALAPVAATRYAEVSGGRDTLQVVYRSATPPGGEKALIAALRERRREEVVRGHTLVGPHRDDLEFSLSGRSARQFASQGQQRSIVVALKFAVREVLAARRDGEPPILLLDDVLSELDQPRQEALLRLAKGGQTLVTAATPANLGVGAGAVDEVLEVRSADGEASCRWSRDVRPPLDAGPPA
jgi:DNA replication and repair protein RecF